MVDMAPELLQQIQSDWSDNLKNDAEIKSLIEKINEGKATYKEVEDLSYRVGKDLSKSLLDNITEDILPNGHVPQNVAEKILHPTLNNAHNLVTNVAVKVQEDMNGLKAQKTDYNEEKAQGLVHKLTNGQFEDTKWILDEPVTLFVQSVADNTLKKNVDFQAHSGLKPQIIRKASSNCCSWCSDLEGTYDYGSEPKDVYRRHERCKCSVDYNPGNGKRQDVWSKAWHEDASAESISERKNILNNNSENNDIMFRKINREKAEDGHEIIDDRTYKKLTNDFIKEGGIIIRGEEAERHLKTQNATASYINGINVAFIRDDATVSDVLEEMYHAYQDKTNMFGKEAIGEVYLKREIDAQKYLLRRKKRYKIPIEEEITTRENLKYYEQKLKKWEEST